MRDYNMNKKAPPVSNVISVEEIYERVQAEYMRSRVLFPSFVSFHEAYGVILEEFDELWDEIKRKVVNVVDIRKEAIQMMAMLTAMIIELTQTLVETDV